MSKSNKTLGIVFIVLLVVAALLLFTNTGKKERSFRKTLVDIDTAQVSEITIYPKVLKGKSVKLNRSGKNWFVELDNNKKASVPKNKIDGIFRSLMSIKPKRLAARSKEQWHSLEVDSLGTRVVVNQGSKKVLDIIIGRFQFHQPRSLSTFVRLNNDNNVYEVDGFLSMAFNKKADGFRDETVLNGNVDKWNKLTFTYPADSSFELVKVDKKWTCNTANIDSAETVKYLNRISHLTSTQFVDNIDTTKLNRPVYSLAIEGENGKNFNVSAYKDSSGLVIHSSFNPDSYFKFKGLGKKIFIGTNSLKLKPKKKK